MVEAPGADPAGDRAAGSNGPATFAGVPVGMLSWLVAVALVATLVSWSGQQAGQILLRPGLGPGELLANLLLFAPIAALIAAAAPGAERVRRTVLRVTLLVVPFSVAIEAIQFTLPGRFTEPFDIVTNTAGAAAMTALVRWGRRRGWSPGRITAVVGGVAFLAIALLLGGSAVLALWGSRMDFWDPTFELVTGDEVTGDRAFIGEVWDARICAGQADERVCAEPGAPFTQRDRLGDRARLSQHMDLTARVRSDSDDQVGPARIATFSRSAVDRNVTLGALGNDLELRLRTPLGGINGSLVAFWLPDALETGVETELAVQVRRGRVEMRAASDAREKSAVFPIGLLTGWRFVGLGPVSSHEMRTAAGAAALVLFLPVGLAAGRLLAMRAWEAALAGAAAAMLLLVFAQALLESPIHLPHLVLAAVIGLAGTGLGRFDRARAAASGDRTAAT